MATSRANHSATLLRDGMVLVVGGVNGGLLRSAELYDPRTGTWTVTASTSIPRNGHSATLLRSGLVLVTGGGTANGTAELYDPGAK